MSHDPFTLDMFGSSALSSGFGLGVTALVGVVTLCFSGWKCQRLVDIQATQAAIFHASKASSRW
ncbi:hypothetical protein ACU8L5_35495 (plasmid) [Rhizobium leguminosarum]|uniref:hypothetical protein n=1 Tax=Rhizobium TaxID=379 RepID=UPI0020CCC5AD|nr:hypothetical protein [Rhizobium anhuiense]UTS88983.1 hypothetical protein NE851_07495 [Rhizobium anhuiense bv. trifolii]